MAERTKQRVKITGGLWDAYKMFKKNNPDTIVSRKQYVDVCHLFNKKISNSIIKESTEFRILWGLGCLRIKSFKCDIKIKNNRIDTRTRRVDWVKTKELWKQIYPGLTPEELHAIKNKKLVVHLNEHSNGYMMRWLWDHRTCAINNNSVYSFKPVKGGITTDGYYYGRIGLGKWCLSDERTNEYYL